jgi:hypothetical protein
MNRQSLHDHALSVVFFGLFATTLVIAAIAGWMEFASQQQAHGDTPEVFASDGYLPFLVEQVTQNVQSEFLALAVMIALAARQIHRGSAQSRDGQDEKKRQIELTRKRVEALVARRTGRRASAG